jgi:hypothetical protein
VASCEVCRAIVRQPGSELSPAGSGVRPQRNWMPVFLSDQNCLHARTHGDLNVTLNLIMLNTIRLNGG